MISWYKENYVKKVIRLYEKGHTYEEMSFFLGLSYEELDDILDSLLPYA